MRKELYKEFLLQETRRNEDGCDDRKKKHGTRRMPFNTFLNLRRHSNFELPMLKAANNRD